MGRPGFLVALALAGCAAALALKGCSRWAKCACKGWTDSNSAGSGSHGTTWVGSTGAGYASRAQCWSATLPIHCCD